MSRVWIGLFLFVAVSHAWAQQPPSAENAPPLTTLRVALAGAPPFVMKEGDVPTGFAVDLWQSVVAGNGWKYEFRAFDTTEAALNAVSAGQCDVLVGNTSITSAREKRVEFSQPFYRAGFQIMVSEQRGQVAQWLGRLAEPQHLAVFGIVFLVAFIATVVVAEFERHHNPDFPKKRSAGFAEAFYYVMGLLLGKSTYKGFSGVLGRLVLVGWMLASLFIVSYVTSVLTSSMTADILQGHINGPQDLPDKLVGLVGGTESENYARDHNLDYAAYPNLEAAVNDLVKGKVQCLIGDAPVLQYYDFTHSRVPIHEVGPIFRPMNYGFAMPMNSPLREPINFVLLHLNESGYFDTLGKKYFGDSYQK
jgi:ABC-type amino acid transport substrate-binding protein